MSTFRYRYSTALFYSAFFLVLFTSGCTFFSGQRLLEKVHCADIDSISIRFLIYHPNPNKYTQDLSPFVRLRNYDLTVTDSVRLKSYREDLCVLLEGAKNVQPISEEEWKGLQRAKAQRMREIEKGDSTYIPGCHLTLFVRDNELIGFSENTIEVTTIDGRYWGISFSKGPFAYATSVDHADSAIGARLLEFCNRIISDKNTELQQNKMYNGTIRLEIHGDSLREPSIPLIKYP